MTPGKSMDTAWTLLEYFDAESAGTLTLLPPGATLPPAGLLAFSDADLEARIEAMPRQAFQRPAQNAFA